MRFALACDAAHAASSQCKAYLGAVVVNLYSGNATEAWASYQVCLLTTPVSTHRLLFILCKAPFRLFLVLPGKFDYVALKHTIAARRVYCIHLLSNLHGIGLLVIVPGDSCDDFLQGIGFPVFELLQL